MNIRGRRTLVRVVWAWGVVSLLPVATARAQGIDCGRPANDAQGVICREPRLIADSMRLQLLYDQAVAKASEAERKTLAAERVRWILERDACASTLEVRPCVTDVYARWEARLAGRGAPPAVVPVPKVATFTCPGDRTLTLEPRLGADEVRVVYGKRSWTLPRVKTASGAQWADADISVWNKGREVIFQESGRATTCTRVEPPAAMPPR